MIPLQKYILALLVGYLAFGFIFPTKADEQKVEVYAFSPKPDVIVGVICDSKPNTRVTNKVTDGKHLLLIQGGQCKGA